jgi:hypothetical protein
MFFSFNIFCQVSVYFTTFKVSAAGVLINPLSSTKTFTSDFTITVLQSALIIFLMKGCKEYAQLFLLQCDSCALETFYYRKLHDKNRAKFDPLSKGTPKVGNCQAAASSLPTTPPRFR